MPDFTQFLQNGVPELPAAVLFLFFFFGTFISEDAACLLAGSAVATNRIGLGFAIMACFLGIFAGDLLLFGIGRALGEGAFRNKFVRRFITDRSAAKAKTWLEGNAALAVFLSRFVTGLRLPTYVAAGAFRTGFTKFALYFLLAAAIWTPILVGSTAFSQTFLFSQNALIGLIATAIAIRVAVKYSSSRNRRLLIGRIRRIVKWEFWPVQVFYVPVVVYVLCLAIKHRSLTAFTAANTAIPAGGFKGESKDEIYKCLLRSPAAAPFLLKHVLLKNDLEPKDRLGIVWRFIDEHQLWFPLVVKPDAGERGNGVAIVRSISELETAVAAAETDLIIQEFADGPEFSLFYYRYPNDGTGRIFSITEKQFPTVIGDGRTSVEKLILNDKRAVCLANKYFEANRNQLERIPAASEKVALIDIGTHSRGAIFLDGERFKTRALEQTIDDMCRSAGGLNFGRFDIRAESNEDLRHARNFKIIEFNGVTSESTNIYDPRYSLADAYRILFRQWQIAFEIGAENTKLGARKTSAIDLLKMTFGVKTNQDREAGKANDDLRNKNRLKCA